MSRRLRAIIATEEKRHGRTNELTAIIEQVDTNDARIAKWLIATVGSFVATFVFGAVTHAKLADPSKLPVNVATLCLFAVFVGCGSVQFVLMARQAKWERPIVKELLRSRKDWRV